MTCIAGCIDVSESGNVIIGADQSASTDNRKWQAKDKKIFKKNGFVMAGAGDGRFIQLAVHNFNPPKPNIKNIEKFMVNVFIEKFSDFMVKFSIDTEASFLVGYKDRLFSLHPDFQIFETDYGYDAIGSGEDFAVGSLHTTMQLNIPTKERVKLALEAATANCLSVYPPYVFMET
jgi:ATP-dependent protease HslVU (ClpYQ) peptidase subunit